MKIDEDGLKALIDSEISNALGYVGKLAAQRQKALYYYFGEAKLELAPPEVDGRSAVVSTDTSDVIEWIMPSLCKIFAGGDDAVSFTPACEEDVEGADQATAFCNYVFYRQNPGFQILHNWFKDALLEKAGIIKCWWDTREDVKREEYKALTQDELALLLEDKTVEIVEQNCYPDPDWTPPPPGMPGPPMPPTPPQSGVSVSANPGAQMQGPPGQPPVGMGVPGQPAGMAPGPMPPGLAMPPAPPQPPLLWDVTVARTKKSQQIRIENVPPEEFLISRRARTMDEPVFVAHRVQRTVSDLLAMGYTQAQVDLCTSDDSWMEFSQEKIERLSFDDEWPAFRQSEGQDPARRIIWLNECYINVDWDGDGIAELRRVVKCGTEILENDAVDDHPFSLLTPIMMPHRVIGLSVADIVADIQRIKTVMLRQYLDSLYLANNPRMYVNTSKQVNLDDLLMVRPGGVVRGAGDDAVVPLVVPHTGQNALEGLQMMDDVRENRTGVSKMNNIADQASINKTATEVNALQNQSNQRIELIARVFAETGVKDAFRKIFKLAQQNAQQKVMLRLNGKFVAVDPREWKTQFDVSINVGLGTGNKDQQVQHLMMILTAQQQALPIGVANPQTIYHALSELTKAVGFKEVGKFWSDPSENPPQPPQPDPMVQAEQIKQAAAVQLKQMDQQDKQQEFQAKAALDQQRMREEFGVQQANDVRQSYLDTQKLEMQREQMEREFQLRQWEKERDIEFQMWAKQQEMGHQSQLADRQMQHQSGLEDKKMTQVAPPNPIDSSGPILQHLQALQASINSPKRIIRGPDGRAVGIEAIQTKT